MNIRQSRNSPQAALTPPRWEHARSGPKRWPPQSDWGLEPDEAPDLRHPGGKASVLIALRDAGFPVPPFVVSPPCLATAVAELGTPLAVRSSASAEDGTDLSFAGQFQSFLNLTTLDEVREAVAHCQASLHAPSVAAYCQCHGLHVHALSMQVIVQRMVEPELAGVAFTVNPSTGREETVIEACAGLADALLAGKQNALPHDDELVQAYRPRIERLASRIQAFFGAPQDIEFAIENGQLYVLQSRPITRIDFRAEEGQWTNADFRDGGVSSTVCSPLMWSLYEYVWDRSLKDTLRELRLFREDFPASRCFFGRPYWNLAAVKSSLALLPGYRERDFDEDLSVQIGYEGDGQTTPFTVSNVLRALPTVVAVPRFLKRQTGTAQRLLKQPPQELLEAFDLAAEARPESRFESLIETGYFPVEYTYFRTIFAASLAKLDFLTAFPEADYISLVAGLPPLRHMRPVHAVQEMPERCLASISALIDQYPYHYRQGLDVIQPRWDEDRDFVAHMLATLPARRDSNMSHLYLQAKQVMLDQLPRRKHRRFLGKLARLRELVWLREELRDVSSFVYHRIRQYALAIARQRGLAEAIFFQTFREIINDDRGQVAERRTRYASFRNFQAPHEIGQRYAFDDQALVPAGGSGLLGIAASPGTVTGRAFVCRQVADAAAMPTGYVLVCPYTDPGWTAVLGRAAGVVTETGGLLSHAAILCREYGIPAVLGVPHATRRIPHLCQVSLQGNTGHIQLIPCPGE